MEIAYHGVDQLDISFQGAIRGEERERLRHAKARAVNAPDGREFIEMNGVKGAVLANGAAGGYAFIFDTGPDGETWTIKDRGNVDEHNVRVSIRSCQLAVKGYAQARDDVLARLAALGGRWITESISRIDYAIDFVAPGFRPDPEALVCHWRNSVKEIPADGPIEFPEVNRRGRRIETLMIGKQPGRQVVIYDKRREVLDRPGSGHWLEIWGCKREDIPQIWRVELRAGKEHLLDWRIKSFADLDARMGDMFEAALQGVRLLSRRLREGENVSRAPAHPIWAKAAEIVSQALGEHVSGAHRGRIIEGRRDEIIRRLAAMVRGMTVTASVALGIPEAEAREALPDWLASDMAGYLENRWPDFRRSRQRASDRLHFLEAG